VVHVHLVRRVTRRVYSRYPSIEDTTETVLISAHYDSRGSFGSVRAPGGNDDGSGIAGLLAIARTIKRLGIRFRSNVELVAFAGEEQGLFGSKHYARTFDGFRVFRNLYTLHRGNARGRQKLNLDGTS
jgi:Zn-dependent M28 family amino/carboxypeptidase